MAEVLMETAGGLKSAFGTLYRILPKRRRRQGLMTLVLMLAGACAEMITVSAVFAYLILLTDPRRLTSTAAWRVVEGSFGTTVSPIIFATSAFLVVLLLTGAVRLLLSWQTSSFSVNAGLDLSAAAFRRVLSQEYKFYLDNGSDKLLSRTERLYIINGVILSGVQAVGSSTMALLLMLFLLVMDPTIAITLGIILFGTYFLVSVTARSTLSSNSRVIAAAHVERVGQIQQAIGGIRDILIDRSQPVFQADFERSGERTRRPNVLNSLLATAPRILIEIVTMISITVVAFFMAEGSGGLVSSLPRLGGLAIGAQRLMPLLQQSYFGWSQFLAFRETFLEVAALLALPVGEVNGEAQAVRPFRATIEFKGVDFGYDNLRTVLADIDLTIRKGERIGIVGTTGSGKSTFTDLLLGLLSPTAGTIAIDGIPLNREIFAGWQSQISHVPQSIYLSDQSIAANIAFGVASHLVDKQLLESAARAAGIHDFIARMPQQYDTPCGERGIRLSGGQRQRIGIARALYKRADVLVLDEATSALDDRTEQAVIESISALSSDITVLMVAHRFSSLKGCDRILSIENGILQEITPSQVDFARLSEGSSPSGPGRLENGHSSDTVADENYNADRSRSS